MDNLSTPPVIESKKQKRDRSFSFFGKVPPLVGLNKSEESMSTSTEKSIRFQISTSKSDDTYTPKVKSPKDISVSLPTTPTKDSYNNSNFLSMKEILDKQICPKCNDNKSVHILDYWKERKELIFSCSSMETGPQCIKAALSTSLNINDESTFKICAYMWVSTQLKPLCVCNKLMRIESHYNDYYYVCMECKSLSHSTREESNKND